jgi:hypothetical protein
VKPGPRHPGLFGVLVSMAVLTGGCTHSSAGSTHSSARLISTVIATYTKGMPPGVTRPAPTSTDIPNPVVAWAGARQLYVTSYGSSSCPSLPSLVQASGSHYLNIKTASNLAPGDNAYCTADLGPTTSTINIPDAIDVSSSIIIDIDGVTSSLQPR